MDVKADVIQNSIGQMCPMPIAHLAKAARKREVGQILELQADDEGAHSDIPAWCKQTNNEFLGEVDAGDHFKYYIKKTE